MPPGEESVKGEAMKKYNAAMADGFTGPTELSTTAVEGHGDLAYAVGTLSRHAHAEKGRRQADAHRGREVHRGAEEAGRRLLEDPLRHVEPERPGGKAVAP